jgi:hypothetical protein
MAKFERRTKKNKVKLLIALRKFTRAEQKELASKPLKDISKAIDALEAWRKESLYSDYLSS